MTEWGSEGGGVGEWVSEEWRCELVTEWGSEGGGVGEWVSEGGGVS